MYEVCMYVRGVDVASGSTSSGSSSRSSTQAEGKNGLEGWGGGEKEG